MKHKAIIGVIGQNSFTLYEVEIESNAEKIILEVEAITAMLKQRIGYDRKHDDSAKYVEDFDKTYEYAIEQVKTAHYPKISYHYFKAPFEKLYGIEISKPTFFTGKTY